MRLRLVVCILICLIFTMPLLADNPQLDALIGPALSKSLQKNGALKFAGSKTSKLVIPLNDEAGKALVNEVELFSPSIIVEVAYLLKKGTDKPWSIEQRLGLYNVLRSISTLSGIEYYSASRKIMRIFYESSYVIADPIKKDKIEDPVVSVIPSNSTIYALQKDSTFGENIYRYEYKNYSDSMTFSQINMTNLSYGFISLLDKEMLHSYFYVSDVGDSLLVYAASVGKATLIPGVEGKVKDSFSNRADAIYKWFVGRSLPILTTK